MRGINKTSLVHKNKKYIHKKKGAARRQAADPSSGVTWIARIGTPQTLIGKIMAPLKQIHPLHNDDPHQQECPLIPPPLISRNLSVRRDLRTASHTYHQRGMSGGDYIHTY